MRTFFKTALLSFFLLAFGQRVFAQTESPSFRDMERQMQELQRQLMDQLRNNPFNDPNFAMPQWDTTFFFHFDTTFEGGNMSHFFRFSPFGSDSTMHDGFLGFGHMFDQLFNPDGGFTQPGDGMQDFPRDDGNAPDTDDGLLPEERLRQQEELEKSGRKATPAPKPDPKVKTIRI